MQDSIKPITPANPTADYPALVAEWMAETIPLLEAGIHNGTLAELIERPDVQEVVGPEVVERYRVIAVEKLKHDPVFRHKWTTTFIEVFQQTIQPPRKLFPAKAASPKWSVEDAAMPSITATYQGELTLRPDQVLSARRWGIWFHFDDELLERLCLTFLVNKSRQRLASNIKNLWNIEATYLSQQSNLSANPEWHSEKRGGRFEHLMMDVLNEFAQAAKPSPLAEDILERTDLRVTYPKIKRKNGSRVQVSLASDPQQHDRKVHAMYHPEEFILLTPLELARCAIHPPTSQQFDKFEWARFWASLGGPWRDVHALAQELHELFVETLASPTRHPLGPMCNLSPSIREFIRTYTIHQAAKSTGNVQERMDRTNKPIGSVRKYTGGYWKAKFAEAAKAGLPTQANPEVEGH